MLLAVDYQTKPNFVHGCSVFFLDAMGQIAEQSHSDVRIIQRN